MMQSLSHYTGYFMFIVSGLVAVTCTKFRHSASSLIGYQRAVSRSGPVVVHRVLDNSELKSRVIIVGDIHGCLDEFQELLVKCNFKPEDCSVILVGDLVNKGPKSAEVISYARQIGALSVRGNHDEAAIAKCFVDASERSAAYAYVDQMTREDIDWLINLPYTISIPQFNAIVVHAGLLSDRPLSDQSKSDMVLMRTVTIDDSHPRGGYRGSEKAELEGVRQPWVQFWQKKPHVYFGHDAKKGLQLTDYVTGLDTGACYGRKLSAMILPERQLVQVDAHFQYQKPKGDN